MKTMVKEFAKRFLALSLVVLMLMSILPNFAFAVDVKDLIDDNGSLTTLEENPIEEGPIGEDPIEENPVEEDPIEENPIEENPIEEGPIGEDPIEENPIEEDPIGEDPIEENPVEEDPIEENPIEEERILPQITTNLFTNYVVGVAQEFTVNVTANDYRNEAVVFHFDFSTPDVVLERKTETGDWAAIENGIYGDAGNVLLTDGQLTLRITFASPCENSVIKVSACDAEGTELCAQSGAVTAKVPEASTIFLTNVITTTDKGAWTNKNDITGTVTAPESYTGALTVAFSTTSNVYSADGGFGWGSVQVAEDGSFTIFDALETAYCLWAVDDYGIVSPVAAVTVDRTSPTVESAEIVYDKENGKDTVTLSAVVIDTKTESEGTPVPANERIAKVYAKVVDSDSELEMVYDAESGNATLTLKDNVDLSAAYTIHAVDWAGNKSIEGEPLKDATPPEITSLTASEDDWTNKDVTVTIVAADNEKGSGIARVFCSTEGEYNAAANAVFQEAALDEDGNYVVTFSEECNTKYYFWAVDGAGNPSEEAKNVEIKIDTTAPKAAISLSGKPTDVLIDSITFGLVLGQTVTISISTDEDTGSGGASTQYYICALDEQSTSILSFDNLEKVGWTPYAGTFERKDEGLFIVYVKTMDAIGNYAYYYSGGQITAEQVDEEMFEIGVVDQTPPEVSVSYSDDVVYNGRYYQSRTATITVKEEYFEEFKGLVISYKKDGVPGYIQDSIGIDANGLEKEEKVFSWNPTGAEYVTQYKFSAGDYSEIKYTATDRAGNSNQNVSYAEGSINNESFVVDSKEPVIDEVVYDGANKNGNGFCNGSRTATITIIEHNFDPEKVTIGREASDGGKLPTYTADDWVNEGNTHTLTLTFEKDGIYRITNINCTDKAGRVGDEKKVNETFTIDTIQPTVSVSYDNNSAENVKYFAQPRTATITVTEHNFGTATVSGVNVQPSWSHNGNTHTAVIPYNEDGDYTFDVSVTDKADNGNTPVNYGNSVAAEAFTIDRTIVEPEIKGIEDGKAYKDKVEFTVKVEDVNYDSYEVSLLRTRMGDIDVDVTEDFLPEIKETANGWEIKAKDFDEIQENDGIYTLKVAFNDKAGNKAEKTIVFTVNRFGSVYTYDSYLAELAADGGAFVQNVSNDVLITEFNADRLVEGSVIVEITRDGRPLENVLYTVSPEINSRVATGESGWFQYAYTISKDNFTEDGVYKISVSSEDATGNTPINTSYEGMEILFRVDGTAPEIPSIIGLEEKIINAQEITVRYTVYDTIGLKSVTVYVDGAVVGSPITDFADDVNNYEGSFVISEKTAAQKVKFVVEDLAGNVTDTDADSFTSAYTFCDSVTVSTNFFVRWFANKPLFFGTVGGGIVLVAGLWIGITQLRKKKIAA